MAEKFVIRDLFRLSDNATVLACEGDVGTVVYAGVIGQIQTGNEVRQSITLIGERKMLNQSSSPLLKAIETSDVVNLSAEEAQSGRWSLLIDG